MAEQVWKGVLGWFSPSEKNLFFTSFCETPAAAPRTPVGSEGRAPFLIQGTLLRSVLEAEPTTATSTSASQLSGQWPHLP